MDYVVSKIWGFKVIGFERVFSLEAPQKEIEDFWDEICEKYCNHTIYAGLAPSCPEEKAIIDNCIGEYGVCIDDRNDGTFRYIIAGRYTGGEVPDSMTVFEIPGGDWAKFSSVGPVPQSLQKLNSAVFRKWLPGNSEYGLCGNCYVEWYSCDREKTDEDYRSELWIPVERYDDEAKKCWGDTEEYRESEKKRASRTEDENRAAADGMNEIFAEFGRIKNEKPDGEKAAELVKKLQNYISENFYLCTDEILSGLGEMYVLDERFKKNIDRVAEDGTAEFVSLCIKNYLQKM